MDVMPVPVGWIYPDRRTPQRSERRKNRPHKGEDRGGVESEPETRREDEHLDVVA
jgi:hypothetical protein